LLSQGALSRKTLSRFQRSFENHSFELLDNIVRQTTLTHLIKPHNSLRTPEHLSGPPILADCHSAGTLQMQLKTPYQWFFS
jgi:hypothetical protein